MAKQLDLLKFFAIRHSNKLAKTTEQGEEVMEDDSCSDNEEMPSVKKKELNRLMVSCYWRFTIKLAK